MNRLLLSLTVLMIPMKVWSMADPLPQSSSQPRSFPVRDYHVEYREEREEASKRAMKKGIEEGRQEGIKEGEMRTRLDLASNMLTLLPSTTNDEIVALLKLPVETVADLRLKIIEQQKK